MKNMVCCAFLLALLILFLKCLERIVELCDFLLPVLFKLEGSSKAVAFLKVAKIGAQVQLFQEDVVKVNHFQL